MLVMMRLSMLMFLMLILKWKLRETISPNATTIAGHNMIVINVLLYTFSHKIQYLHAEI